MLSEKFIRAVKLAPLPQYRLAVQANISPDDFSKYLHGARKITQRTAPKLIQIAEGLGLRRDEVFQPPEGQAA